MHKLKFKILHKGLEIQYDFFFIKNKKIFIKLHMHMLGYYELITFLYIFKFLLYKNTRFRQICLLLTTFKC